jgi:hypothetical protein
MLIVKTDLRRCAGATRPPAENRDALENLALARQLDQYRVACDDRRGDSIRLRSMTHW